MESGSKKRNIRNDVEEDDDEEEKMEQFYALINTICEARDGFINNTKKRKVEEGKHVAVWKPSFQRQDFMQDDAADDQLKKKLPHVSFACTTTSRTKEAAHCNDPKEKVKEGLDLDLTLSL